ncbi:hypothetical protein C1702_16445 [Caldimonas thermodepolymerans]|uniref:Uncharacterized protein n=1 Tax=Caldimonas thermodepolymerans TaxID=215580 RepID=A0A2S5T0Y7_9BURK|nr:hypothetical protein C1702_16445 [Caldimonas thermodepolymerans]
MPPRPRCAAAPAVAWPTVPPPRPGQPPAHRHRGHAMRAPAGRQTAHASRPGTTAAPGPPEALRSTRDR